MEFGVDLAPLTISTEVSISVLQIEGCCKNLFNILFDNNPQIKRVFGQRLVDTDAHVYKNVSYYFFVDKNNLLQFS